MAEQAKRGELPVLGWKGGVERKLTVKKYGTLNYLAQWQGLRGDDLDIDPDQEVELTCTKTSMAVTFTADSPRWSTP